jgi:hypothetical protein
MHDEWPEYLHETVETAAPALRPDLTDRWNRLCLTAALEHLSQRREQVKTLKRRVALFMALALVEGGILLGLLLRYVGG